MNNTLQQKNEKEKYHSYTYALMLYFLIAPMEDLLTGSLGSLARYVGILIVFLGILETRGKIHLRREAGDLAIIWIMLLGVFSCLWATNLEIAVRRNITYILLPAIFLYIGTLDFSSREHDAVFAAAVIGGLMTVAYLFVSGKMNISGFMRLELNHANDPNNFAALLLTPFAIGMDFFFTKKGFRKFLGLICAILMLFTILLTGSRGGLLSAVAFLLMYFVISKAYKKLGLLLSVLAVIAIAWFVIVPLLPEFIRWRLFDIASYDAAASSANQRGRIWKIIITQIIPHMPPWGYGAGNSPIVLSNFYNHMKGVHNTYLNMILEYGIFGIPAFLWMLWSKFRIQVKEKRVLEAALLVAICVTIFFLDSYPKKFFWNVLILIVIRTRHNELNNNQEQADTLQSGEYK